MLLPDTTTDLLTVGEALLRLSVPADELLLDANTLAIHAAGAESNVAVAVAQLGYRTRWWSRLTDNVLGQRIARTLTGYGVDCTQVEWTAEDRVGTFYLQFGAAPRPTQVIYDRAYSAASKMEPKTFDLDRVAQARIVHLTGITAALSDSCYALIDQIIERCIAHRVHIVFDVNFRSLLWNADSCRAKLTPLLSQVSTLILAQRDAAGIFGVNGKPEQIIRSLNVQFPVPQIAVTLGSEGAIGLENDRIIEVGGYETQIVDRIGAGDAFAAGVICGLLDGSFEQGLRYGVAMSALQLTLKGDLFRLSRADVLSLLENNMPGRLVR